MKDMISPLVRDKDVVLLRAANGKVNKRDTRLELLQYFTKKSDGYHFKVAVQVGTSETDYERFEIQFFANRCFNKHKAKYNLKEHNLEE